MALETEFDNEGIKKGLQQITLQLNETNKQLAEQGKPNLFKAFKENQAEVFASFAISQREMKHQQKIADAVSQDPGTVKVPRDAKGRAISRRPAEGDTLYGLMAKLVNIQGDQQDMFEEAKDEATKLREAQERKEKERYERLVKLGYDKQNVDQRNFVDNYEQKENEIDEAREARIQARKDSYKFRESFRRGFTGLKNANLAQAKLTRMGNRLLGKGLLIRAKLLKRNFLQGKTFEKIGKSFGKFFMTNKKDKKDRDSLLMKGLKKLGGIFKSGLNALTSTFGFILKTAAVLLSIGLIFKFLDSDYWKKIKPNIGQIIAESVIVAENIVNMLITVVKDVLIPALLGLAKVALYVAKTIGGIFGMQFAEGTESEIRKEVGAMTGLTEEQKQKEIRDKIESERKLFMMTNDPTFKMKYGSILDAPGMLIDYLMGKSIDDVRKDNALDFKTKMSDSGASLGGFTIVPDSMKSSMGNVTNIINQQKGGDETTLLSMQKAFRKAGFIDNTNSNYN